MHVLESGHVDQLAIVEPDPAVAAVAQPERARRDDVEDRLGVRLGATDRAQDLARGRLPGEGASQLGVTRVQLREQANVLDGDDRLVGEGPDERDLLFGEGPRLLAPAEDDAERHPVAEHRHGQKRPVAEPPASGFS